MSSSKVGSSRLRMSSSHAATKTIDPSLLAKAWTPQIIDLEKSSTKNNDNSNSPKTIQLATERTLPLLEDVASVPFVCRYRTDVIDPLTTRQVHFLQSLISKHASLESLRSKLLQVITNDDDKLIHERIQTSTSKTELEDLYAPFKPPSKGSILERIQQSQPQLVEAVDNLWNNKNKSTSVKLSKLGPRQELIQLLSTKIAAEPKTAVVVMEELYKHCRVKTTSDDSKYRNYDNFSGHLAYLKDHQVLAIRRGVQQKVVKMSYEIDGSKMEGCIKYHLRHQELGPPDLFKRQDLLDEAVHDAWTRLLRRRGTSRIWSEKCKDAQERGCQVFEDNLRRALLAPPLIPASPVLSLDPGFQAGIKCAILDSNGVVIKLDTIKFLGSKRDDGVAALGRLLDQTKRVLADSSTQRVLVALGNGHGSQDCRTLLLDACKQQDIDVDIQLVNEAGASVWSVTETAKTEFPDHPPAAIAAISIGRRLQNPLFELVKVPPKSLGLGMYQHDMSEKELDEKLYGVSVDAVATVGVEVNSCSLEILKQVPGLNKLADKVIQARPLKQRSDLLNKVSRLGAKTFENCAAFCRINNGPEPLDNTLVHPESYDLARWLLKKFSWNLDEKPKDIPPKTEWKQQWGKQIGKASTKFALSEDRVIAVLNNLIDSMLKVDPRLVDAGGTPETTVGSIDNCSALPAELSDVGKLAAATPVRHLIGTIRNIADFGAFIDFGAENDGLLHTSKLGPLKLSNLLIGQELGVDVLNVVDGKVSLGVAGLNQEPSLKSARKPRSTPRHQDNRSGAKRSISSKSAGRRAQKRRKIR